MIVRLGMCRVNVTEYGLRHLFTSVILPVEHNIFEHLCILLTTLTRQPPKLSNNLKSLKFDMVHKTVFVIQILKVTMSSLPIIIYI